MNGSIPAVATLASILALAPCPQADHLDLVLEISADGEVRVLSATAVSGRPASSAVVTGDHAVEVARGEVTLFVESIPDPFLGHSFGGPADERLGHHPEALERATVKVKVPRTGVDGVDPEVVVRLLRIRDAGTVQRLDPQMLGELRRAQRLEVVASVAGEEISRQLRALREE